MMKSIATINWIGKSGILFKYWVYPLETIFDRGPINFIFAEETKPGLLKPIYIGETENLSEHTDIHNKKSCVEQNGATHIAAHKGSTSDRVRLAEKFDLIDNYNPKCNIHSLFSEIPKIKTQSHT